MREIKFRAYIKNLGWMLPVSMIDFENETIYVSLDSDEWSNDPLEYDFDDKDIEIMQYTGMTDKNGKEIYEGDILKGNYHFKGEGWFDTGEGDYKICSAVEFRNGKFICQSFNVGEMTYCVKVIGNIYENPELMEVADGC